MAAISTKHVESKGIFSFEGENVERKLRRRKQPYVKVSYDSGSDADAESGDDNVEKTAKRVKLSKRKTKPSASDDDSPASSGDDSRASSDDNDEDESNNDEDESNSDEDESNNDEDASNINEDESNNEKDEANNDESDAAESEQMEPGAGWADAMAKILRNETPSDDDVVLSKSKEYAKKKAEEDEHIMQVQKEREDHRNWENLYRVKPKVTERERERGLQRTATRGVVQLFNAVKKQQKFLEDKLKEAGSETKRMEIEASISKGDFLDLLKGSNKEKKSRKEMRHLGQKKREKAKTKEQEKPMWSVLREDFMMGAKMKDWDKGHSEENTKPKGKDVKR